MMSQRIVDFMKKTEFFGSLSSPAQAQLATIARPGKYLKGNIIFFEGDQVNGFYIMVSGRAKIYKTSTEGREHIIRIITPRMVVGEAVVLGGDTYPATLEAVAASELFFLPKIEFLEMVRNSPNLAMELLTLLSKRLRFLIHMVEDLSLKEVSARITKYLLDQCSIQYGQPQKGAKVSIPIPKHELASALGTIPETLSRTLKKMEAKGFIRNERQTVILVDLAGLQQLAAGQKL